MTPAKIETRDDRACDGPILTPRGTKQCLDYRTVKGHVGVEHEQPFDVAPFLLVEETAHEVVAGRCDARA